VVLSSLEILVILMISSGISNKKENEEETSYRSVTRGLTSRGSSIAACGSSVINTLITYPLDLLKTRFQVHDGKRTNIPNYKNSLQGLYYIFRSEGLRGLYCGASTGMIGAAIAWASYMYIYSSIKDEFEARGTKKLRLWHIAVASITGGIGTMLITNPIWVVKTRLQLQIKNPNPTNLDGIHKHYRSPRDAFLRMAQEEGIGVFYRGLGPSLLSTYHGFVQFAIYENLSSLMIKYSGNDNLSDWIPLAAGGCSKICALLSTYPLTLVRARLQEERCLQTEQRKFKSSLDVVWKLIESEGLMAFYKGLGPSLLRLTVNSALFFYFFEKIKMGFERFNLFTKHKK